MRWLNLCLLAATLGCQNTGALHVRADVDEAADFRGYATYALAPPPGESPGLPAYTEIAGRKLNGLIAARLEETRLTPAPWEEADLQVSFLLDGQARTDVWHFEQSWAVNTTVAARMRTASLQVDVYDRRRGEVVWRGQAWQETMDEALGEERGLRAMERLMARYPETFPPPR